MRTESVKLELPELKPFDILVVEGLWYMPHHWLIRWRGNDTAVHCMTIADSSGNGYNPTFVGIKLENVSKYHGRQVTIHRHKGELDYHKLGEWALHTYQTSKGYDFFRQWLLGFVCGMNLKNLVNDESKWTCAEFPYWLFHSNGYSLTEIEEQLPMPRLFRYNDHFETIYEGKI